MFFYTGDICTALKSLWDAFLKSKVYRCACLNNKQGIPSSAPIGFSHLCLG